MDTLMPITIMQIAAAYNDDHNRVELYGVDGLGVVYEYDFDPETNTMVWIPLNMEKRVNE